MLHGRQKGEMHSVNHKPRIYLLGDELTPILAGSGGECMSVFRTESGSFEQMQSFLEHQFSAGLRPPEGSIAVALLMTQQTLGEILLARPCNPIFIISIYL